MSTASPLSSSVDLPVFQILSNGTSVEKECDKLIDMEVVLELNKVPTATLKFKDGMVAKRDFPLSDSDFFLPGKEIEIKVGYDLKAINTLFKGIVVRHELGAQSGEGPYLKVVCKHKAIKMTKVRSNLSTQKTKDSDAISSLISKHGLTGKVDETSATLPVLIQANATDWDFMLMRAAANGFVVIADPETGEGVGFNKINTSGEAVLSLTFGQDLLSFETALEADHQYASVSSSAWDFANQQVIEAEASPENPLGAADPVSTKTLSAVTGSDPFVLPTSSNIPQDFLQDWAKATMLRSELARAKGQFRLQGSAKAKPGDLIKLNGLSKRFNGNAYVSKVVHTFPQNNWNTEIHTGLNIQTVGEVRAISARPAANLLPPMHGLQNATVKQIAGEDDNLLNVLVEISSLESGKNEVWARMSTMYATDQAGTFFYPETGDEVILGFINDNPDDPIILGSLYNSNSKNPPFTPDEKNSNKAIVTNAQLKITFDDENKVLQITTPGNNQVTFSDEDGSITISDQNSNSIKLSSSGIDINSASNINLNAQENINLNATANLTLAATAEAKLNGATVSVEAEAELTAQGAMTKLAGSGITTIQGGIVNIN